MERLRGSRPGGNPVCRKSRYVLASPLSRAKGACSSGPDLGGQKPAAGGPQNLSTANPRLQLQHQRLDSARTRKRPDSACAKFLNPHAVEAWR